MNSLNQNPKKNMFYAAAQSISIFKKQNRYVKSIDKLTELGEYENKSFSCLIHTVE